MGRKEVANNIHPLDIHIGRKMKEARRLKGYNQGQLGRELDISAQQIHKYEAGVNRISASILYNMSQILDVTYGYFIDGFFDRKKITELERRAIEMDEIVRQNKGPIELHNIQAFRDMVDKIKLNTPEEASSVFMMVNKMWKLLRDHVLGEYSQILYSKIVSCIEQVNEAQEADQPKN